MPKTILSWKDEPEEKDYEGAESFLSLIFTEVQAKKIVRALRKAKAVDRKPKDVLRASGLALLGRDNPEVGDDIRKIGKGKALAPILLIRGDMMSKHQPLIIADGYHRICAVSYIDDEALVPCKLVDLPAG